MIASTTWAVNDMNTTRPALTTMYHNATDAPDLGFCPGGWETLCFNEIHPSGLKYFFEFVLFVYSFAGLAIVCDDYLGQCSKRTNVFTIPQCMYFLKKDL